MRRPLFSILFVVLLPVAPAGCKRDSEQRSAFDPAGGKDAGVKPVPVEVVALATGPIESALRFSANLEAENQILVVSRAQGQVVKLAVEEGKDVARGQLLLKIQDDEPRSQLARARHDLAKAEREHELQKKARDQGIVSDQDYEQARYELERLRLIAQDAARALQYTTVSSPIAGTVTRRLVDRGDMATPNQQLFEVTDFDSIVARIYVPEKQLGELSPGLPARISAQAQGSQIHAGKVDRVAPIVDPNSGTVKVTISIPRDAGVWPGMFVEVELVTDRRSEVLLLPRRALVYDSDEVYAFVVDGDRAEKRPVVTVIEDRDHVQPENGFKAGDRVVVAGQVGLKHGALVEAKAPPGAPPEDSASR